MPLEVLSAWRLSTLFCNHLFYELIWKTKKSIPGNKMKDRRLWLNKKQKTELGGSLELCSCNGCTWECQLCVILQNKTLFRLSQPFQNRKLFFLFSYFKSVIWSLTSCNCIILFLLAFLRRQKGNGNLSEVSSLTTLWSVNGLLFPLWPHCVWPCLDSIWNLVDWFHKVWTQTNKSQLFISCHNNI